MKSFFFKIFSLEFIKFFKKRTRGAIIIEAAVTMPIVFSLIFFTLELARINLVKVALDSMVEEMVYSFSRYSGDYFSQIIVKHAPKFITNDLTIWVRFYTSVASMCARAPYGGEAIVTRKIGAYMDPHICGARTTSLGIIDYLENNYRDLMISWDTSPEGNCGTTGRAFVVTVTCRYPFSNDYVKMFFGKNGVNAVASSNGTPPSSYILWARGAGIMNKAN